MIATITAAVVVPIGPGRESALDTLDSVNHYCTESHVVIVMDDCTTDGTYEALKANQRPNWRLLRNLRPMGRDRLVHSLAKAYRFVLDQFSCPLVLRLDQDGLIIKNGVISDALAYAEAHRGVGVFGVYERDYDRPRSCDVHRTLIDQEMRWYRKAVGREPSWSGLLRSAEERGYKRGDNVFGGAYFLTRACLEKMRAMGALDVPFRWNSRLMEDVYFSMAAVAGGFELGHFAAPDGPLCLEWRGLPHPAGQLIRSHFKLVHSVDRGQNTGRDANDHATAREVFAGLRRRERDAIR